MKGRVHNLQAGRGVLAVPKSFCQFCANPLVGELIQETLDPLNRVLDWRRQSIVAVHHHNQALVHQATHEGGKLTRFKSDNEGYDIQRHNLLSTKVSQNKPLLIIQLELVNQSCEPFYL